MRVSSIFQFYPPHPGTCLHWGIKPSQDQEPLLPQMSDKVILCYICSWNHGLVLSPWVLWTVWLVHIVVIPIRLQTHSAPSVLPVSCLLGTPWSVWYLSVSISLFSCQEMAELLRRASTCWYPQLWLGLVSVYGMDPQVGQTMDSYSFSLCSALCLHIFFQGVFCSPF